MLLTFTHSSTYKRLHPSADQPTYPHLLSTYVLTQSLSRFQFPCLISNMIVYILIFLLDLIFQNILQGDPLVVFLFFIYSKLKSNPQRLVFSLLANYYLYFNKNFGLVNQNNVFEMNIAKLTFDFIYY